MTTDDGGGYQLPRLRYRKHSKSEKRTPRGRLRYSDHEWAAIVGAAALEGMKASAWVQQIAAEVASGQHEIASVQALLGELAQYRRVLRNIEGNLADVMRAALRSSQSIQAEVMATKRAVRRVIADVDDVTGRIRFELRGG